jgi:hypothetical protein
MTAQFYSSTTKAFKQRRLKLHKKIRESSVDRLHFLTNFYAEESRGYADSSTIIEQIRIAETTEGIEIIPAGSPDCSRFPSPSRR